MVHLETEEQAVKKRRKCKVCKERAKNLLKKWQILSQDALSMT